MGLNLDCVGPFAPVGEGLRKLRVEGCDTNLLSSTLAGIFVKKEQISMKRKTCLVLFALATTLLQGCMAAGGALALNSIMKSQEHQHYADYVTQTERINLEREKANLPPEKIMTFKEWKGET